MRRSAEVCGNLAGVVVEDLAAQRFWSSVKVSRPQQVATLDVGGGSVIVVLITLCGLVARAGKELVPTEIRYNRNTNNKNNDRSTLILRKRNAEVIDISECDSLPTKDSESESEQCKIRAVLDARLYADKGWKPFRIYLTPTCLKGIADMKEE